MGSQSEIKIRRVKVLGDRARKQALSEGLKNNDIVLIESTVSSLPTFIITKVEGSPSTFIENYFFDQNE